MCICLSEVFISGVENIDTKHYLEMILLESKGFNVFVTVLNIWTFWRLAYSPYPLTLNVIRRYSGPQSLCLIKFMYKIISPPHRSLPRKDLNAISTITATIMMINAHWLSHK